MITAFQKNAFQNNAFQIEVIIIIPPDTNPRGFKIPLKFFRERMNIPKEELDRLKKEFDIEDDEEAVLLLVLSKQKVGYKLIKKE
jgi:hypothetical protein